MNLADGKESQDSASQRYRALLAATDAISLHQQMPELFQELAKRLRPIVGFATVYFVLHDPDKQVMRSTMVEGPSLHPLEVPMNGTATGHVFETQQPIVINDSHEEEHFPLVLDKMREQGIRSVCVLPMSTAQRRLGALVFCSTAPNEYDAADLEFLESVSNAIAVENGIHRKEAEH
jgi:formate hydrogenlyase transcriptional activator